MSRLHFLSDNDGHLSVIPPFHRDGMSNKESFFDAPRMHHPTFRPLPTPSMSPHKQGHAENHHQRPTAQHGLYGGTVDRGHTSDESDDETQGERSKLEQKREKNRLKQRNLRRKCPIIGSFWYLIHLGSPASKSHIRP